MWLIRGCLRSMPRFKTISEGLKLFLRNMQKENGNAAIKSLTNNMKNDILPLDNKTLSKLRMNHLDAKPAAHEMLFQDLQVITYPIRLKLIDEEMIKIPTLKVKRKQVPLVWMVPDLPNPDI